MGKIKEKVGKEYSLIDISFLLIRDVRQIWMVSHMARSRYLYAFLFQISFLDYMAYLPLFLSIHQNICDNALDMSRNKYQRKDTWPRVTLETIWRAEWRSARFESQEWTYKLCSASCCVVMTTRWCMYFCLKHVHLCTLFAERALQKFLPVQR